MTELIFTRCSTAFLAMIFHTVHFNLSVRLYYMSTGMFQGHTINLETFGRHFVRCWPSTKLPLLAIWQFHNDNCHQASLSSTTCALTNQVVDSMKLTRPTAMFKNTFVLTFPTPDHTNFIRLPGTNRYLLPQYRKLITVTTQGGHVLVSYSETSDNASCLPNHV